MSLRFKSTPLFGALLVAGAGLMGCEPLTTLPPMEEVSLPTALSSSYLTAFAQNPETSAHRFLTAYDSFSRTGPVTRAKVLDYTRMQDALERGRLLGHILAVDMDGDGRITRAEHDTYSALPQGGYKRLRLSDLFQFDETADEVISLREAILYSRELHVRAATGDMRPIESYFMLFDENSDGVLSREELKQKLIELFPLRQAEQVSRAERPRKNIGLRPVASPQ